VRLYPNSIIRSGVLIGVAAFLVSGPCKAENIIFPHVKTGISDASGIIDVSLAPYSLDKTGQNDVTAALQKIFDDNKRTVVVYLPNGTYLVSNTIKISQICVTGGVGDCGVNAPLLRGQSKTGTVIKLAAGKFTSAGSPSPVLFAGDGVAQIFGRGIQNLMVLVGPNNAGANGIRWYANNTGLMSDVNVLCEDGSANIGVDIAGGEQGPCGMRDIYVKGFGIGCKSNALNSVTVLNLTVENSRTFGVLNEGNPLYIDNLVCKTAPTGVRNVGSLLLLNAQFSGGSSTKSAIDNVDMLFARDISSQGYQKALSSTTGSNVPTGSAFTEFSTGISSLFPSPSHSMDLPYRPLPDVAWEQDTTKWGNVWVNTGGLGGNRKTDSASLQSLIDNPNLTTICVPAGKGYTINGDILIRGNISRIVGTGSNLGGAGRLVITNECTQPVIKLDRLGWSLPIVNQSSKTVVIESYTGTITSTGAGDLFLSDVCCNLTINNANERVWAWQLNAEGSSGYNVQVQNVLGFRIVGWKDEGVGYSLQVTKGAVEVLGFMNYPNGNTSSQTMFVIQDGGQLSISCASQISFTNSYYTNLVQETRAGVTKTLTSGNSGTGSNMPLFVGYDSAKVAGAVPVVQARNPVIATHGLQVRTEGRTIFVAGPISGTGYALRIFAVDGSRVVNCRVHAVDRGSYAIEGLSSGLYTILADNGRKIAHRVMVP
jgi:hypothetical protein